MTSLSPSTLALPAVPSLKLFSCQPGTSARTGRENPRVSTAPTASSPRLKYLPRCIVSLSLFLIESRRRQSACSTAIVRRSQQAPLPVNIAELPADDRLIHQPSLT